MEHNSPDHLETGEQDLAEINECIQHTKIQSYIALGFTAISVWLVISNTTHHTAYISAIQGMVIRLYRVQSVLWFSNLLAYCLSLLMVAAGIVLLLYTLLPAAPKTISRTIRKTDPGIAPPEDWESAISSGQSLAEQITARSALARRKAKSFLTGVFLVLIGFALFFLQVITLSIGRWYPWN